jgi:hypothetical protein
MCGLQLLIDYHNILKNVKYYINCISDNFSRLRTAMRNITHVEVPSLSGGYSAFYNPGGPGTTPYPDAIYTAPGPPDLEHVIMALNNPMRVTN